MNLLSFLFLKYIESMPYLINGENVYLQINKYLTDLNLCYYDTLFYLFIFLFMY